MDRIKEIKQHLKDDDILDFADSKFLLNRISEVESRAVAAEKVVKTAQNERNIHMMDKGYCDCFTCKALATWEKGQKNRTETP